MISCKACGQTLREDGQPTGNGLVLHRHHVIPQAFGGAKGPTVDLCSSDHNLLHAVALCMTGHKPYQHMVSGLPEPQRDTVLWLASRVAVAFEATKDDPNKRVQVNIILPAKIADKLDKVSKTIGSSSRQETIVALITDAYRKRFVC